MFLPGWAFRDASRGDCYSLLLTLSIVVPIILKSSLEVINRLTAGVKGPTVPFISKNE